MRQGGQALSNPLPADFSGVFREARSNTKPPLLVEFTDTDFETASVLFKFLSLIVEGEVVALPEGKWTDPVPVSKLVLFLRKYSCDVHLKVLKNHIKLRENTSPLIGFTIAALQDDTTWCAELLNTPSWTWKLTATTCDDLTERGSAKGSQLDPRGSPYPLWNVLPREYVWALSRAWTSSPKEADREARAKAFERFITAVKKGEYSLEAWGSHDAAEKRDGKRARKDESESGRRSQRKD